MPADRVPAPDNGTGWVRPYARTDGRTTPSRALPVEALVCTADTGARLGRSHPAEISCIGAPLARLEGRVALNLLLDRFPVLAVDPDDPPEFQSNPNMTGVRKLALRTPVGAL